MSRRGLKPPPVYDAEPSSSEESDGAEEPQNDDEDYDEVASGTEEDLEEGTEEDLEEEYVEADEAELSVGDEGSKNANDVNVPLGDVCIKWIHEHIENLQDSEIGSFRMDNSNFLHVMNSVKSARKKIDEPNDDFKVCMEMTKLAKDKEFTDRFRSLSKVSEFIIHMHHVYQVNLNPNCSVDDGDSVLVGTIRSALGKS